MPFGYAQNHGVISYEFRTAPSNSRQRVLMRLSKAGKHVVSLGFRTEYPKTDRTYNAQWSTLQTQLFWNIHNGRVHQMFRIDSVVSFSKGWSVRRYPQLPRQNIHPS